MKVIKIKGGSRSQLDAARDAGELNSREPYLIMDEGRIAIGTGTSSYESFAKESELEDEKVAVNSTGTPGYLWGTNGSDGIIRTNGSLSVQKDINDSYINLAVEDVDGGTF